MKQKLPKHVNALYGKNSVVERLRANPKSIRQVYLQDNFEDFDIIKKIKSQNIPIMKVSENQLCNIKKADRLQGIVAVIDEYRYTEFESFLDDDTKPTIIFLDRINDPQNLGVIIRTAACFGEFVLVIPRHDACKVTDAVLHVANGGENYARIALVSNLTQAIMMAKKAGYWVAGAVVDEGEDLARAQLTFPLGIVMGSEGDGVRYGVDKHLDFKLKIPMEGAELSFNVAMAASIFCYEISSQRSKGQGATSV